MGWAQFLCGSLFQDANQSLKKGGNIGDGLGPLTPFEVVGNRAVYRQSKGEDDWGDTYVFYDKPDQKWKRANEATEGVVAMNTSRMSSGEFGHSQKHTFPGPTHGFVLWN